MEYPFRCKDCKEEFSLSMKAFRIIGSTISCPKCKGTNVYRVFTPPLVVYKGKGFYSTDNKK